MNLLESRNFVTSIEFMGVMEISRSTLKRDITFLRDRFDVPIIFDRDMGAYKLEKDLEHQLGRTPTTEELSHHSGMSVKAVTNTLKSKKTSTGISSLFDSPTLFSSQNDEWVQFVYHDLSDKDKLIFEHKTGFGGKPILDNVQLSKKLNLSVSTLSNRLKLINSTLSKGWK
jgi:DNA-directed RNA polymerase specialized sigma subunit